MTVLSQEDRQEIQGILTTGFGHLRVAGFVFVRFADPAGGRAWLADLVPQVTTAAPWDVDDNGDKRKPGATLNVAFTFPGLVTLGLPPRTDETFPTEFAVGMAQRAAVLGDSGDSAPENWEIGGPRNEDLHALLIVYALDDAALDARLDELRATFGAAVVEVASERGARTDRSREHFGFASDGISQPTIQGVRSEDAEPSPWVIRTGEFILGHLNELGLYPRSPAVAVADDPHGVLPRFPEEALPDYRDLGRNGTYLVYRKLRQDVAGFWRFLQDTLEARPAEMLATAAKLMGRWPSGAPLVLAPDADDPALATSNDFMYRLSDEVGHSCPVGAHVRRANPRDALKKIADSAEESIRTSNQHRLLRRGIPYGSALFPEERIEDGNAPVDLETDGAERGLQFFAINADTKRQFEFVQQTWLNNPTFAGLHANKDPIVGDNAGDGQMVVQRNPVRRHVNNIPRFVAVRGGAYLFIPSMAALRFLSRAV
jgi:Dyp-type peroxidase family